MTRQGGSQRTSSAAIGIALLVGFVVLLYLLT
jgi:hypothetical protein